MKFSLSWLQEFISILIPAPEIANKLTSAGLEVDSIESISSSSPSGNGSAFNNDSLFEVSLTPNLGHCSSMIGIARELSAAKLGTAAAPKITFTENSTETDSLIKVTVADPKRCPRYTCRIVQNVAVAPSPIWMQQRLESAGIRSINNIVDITNYVALETGQPLHAFDYDLLGNAIVVRTATEGETITTLDNQVRELTTEDLLICDNRSSTHSRPIALAGVMGGLETEVTEKTVNVLIEAANFHPGSIRRTSRRLGLSTDASKRYERSVDPNSAPIALNRAAMLMQQFAQGNLTKGSLDIKEKEFTRRHITCRLARVNQLLGTLLGVSEMEDIFSRLEFIHEWDGKELFNLQIPTYRADVTSEIDVVEEIARIYGYDNIGSAQPKYHGSLLPHAPMYLFEKKARAHMLANNLQEFLTCDLIGPTILNVIKELSMPPEATVKVLNPTSIEQSILRTSMLPGLLQVVKYNHDHQNSDLMGFEIGRIHFKTGDNYKEQSMLGIVLSGDADLVHWSKKTHKLDFFDLKGLVESFLEGIGVAKPLFKISNMGTFHPGRQLTIYAAGLKIGTLGEVHPSIVKRLDVPERILFAEINLHDLYQIRTPEEKVTELPLFPSSERDWTVTLSTEMPLVEIFDQIHSISSDLLESVTLIDIYESDKLGKDKRNATFHFIYRDKQKTIAQAAVDAEHKRIIESIKTGVGQN